MTLCVNLHKRYGAQGRNRTTDTAIFSRMLYQLSYLGAVAQPPAARRMRAYRRRAGGLSRRVPRPARAARFRSPEPNASGWTGAVGRGRIERSSSEGRARPRGLREKRFMRAFAVAVILAAMAAPAAADPLPTHVGQCASAKVKQVETRLQDGAGQPVADSGSAIEFFNGGYQVSYEQVAALDASRRGDRVRICLIEIPRDCPPGDNRGRIYRTTNLRTGLEWTLPNSEHSCGGA